MMSPALSGNSVSQTASTKLYLQLLTWAFTLFNSARVVAYLPTILAICASGEAAGHSVLTWITWTGANLTMAGWLFEQNGRVISKPIVVNLCNAAMCLATLATIAAYRA
jgi:hypothetical protein